MTDPLKKVREKVIAAVPEIVNKWWNKKGRTLKGAIEMRDIRLADVLLAIDRHSNTHHLPQLSKEYPALVLIGCIVEKWNLAKDSLDDQSPEGIAFLESLL